MICPTWQQEYFYFSILTQFLKIRIDLPVGLFGRRRFGHFVIESRPDMESVFAIPPNDLRLHDRP